MSDKLIEIIEDHNSMVQTLRFFIEAAETKELPSWGLIPTFNDDLLEDQVFSILEMITGKKYER
jgi:hypothetical protein